MTQQGVIRKLLPNHMAEIEVTRRSACGHDCAKCGGCGGLETQTLYITAHNRVDAQTGERVLIEGETKQILGIAVLVYMLPLVLFFIGYACASVIQQNEGIRALWGGIFFLLGIGGAILYNRHIKKKDKLFYQITKRL